MARYTRVNLKRDVQDMAPQHGMSGLDSRFARANLELERSGVSYLRLEPGFRMPFGHRHAEQEEVYVLVSGSARQKLDDQILELEDWDAVRIPAETWRALEAGSDGAELLALSAPNTGNRDVEVRPGWWRD